MNAEQKKERVRQYYEEVWCAGKMGIVDELFAAGYENCDPATPGGAIKGRDAFKSFALSYREAFPDLRLDIIEQWCDGDTVVSRWHASGTHRGALMGIPATGRSAKGLEGVTISTFAGDRIVQDRAVWDLHGLLRSLGVVPG
jgi:steroid delta-isomerase-like uncharacterized protein